MTDELAYLKEQVLRPARQAAEAIRVRDENQRRDPIQRFDSAGELIREAAVLSQVAVVPYVRVKGLGDALSGVKTFGSIPTPTPCRQPEPVRLDPLVEALKAIHTVAKAIRDGHYGNASVDGARNSRVYATWLEISREVDGTDGNVSLLRALQARGWVKVRGSVAR